MDEQREPLPEKLGKYEVIGELGRGSMAVVYLGHDPFIDRKVAIKVALGSFVEQEGMRERFKKMFFNEARIAGMLDNKYILPVYDAGEEDGQLYMVMEYISGGKTLKEFCSEDTLLPIPTVLEVIYKCCVALDYAHRNEVVHRDIKPGNILLTGDMDIRIADFGIAQLAKTEDTQFIGVWGSPLYMSPEQTSDGVVTGQSDLFALGVVMYQLLTGNVPFQAESIPGLFKKINEDEPPLMKTFRPDVPESLEPIIKRALAKNPQGRYPTGMDLAGDLVLAFKQQKHLASVTDDSQKEKFEMLKKNPFFRGFFDSEIWEILKASEWNAYKEGEVVITEGELDDSFFVIVKGEVEVVKGRKSITTLKAGDCFGEMGYLSKVKRTASIIASGDLSLIKVSSTLMEKTSSNCQIRFMKVFLHTLIERLSFTSELLAGQAGGGGERAS